MRGAQGDINCLSGGNANLFIIESNRSRSLDHEPMLSPLRVLLIAQSFARQNLQAFDFEIFSFIEYGERTPGTLIKFR